MITTAIAAFVALQHIAFLVLEMFLWEKPIGRKVFRQTAQNAAITAVLAKNQGLYNGFLAAGLIWGVMAGGDMGTSLIRFFLGCVAVAGAYGAMTVSPRIFFVQAVPALIGLGLGMAGL